MSQQFIPQQNPGGIAEASFTLPTTSTAAAGMVSWVNPLSRPVWATVTLNWTTAGSAGTFDMGISDDGTGSDASIIDGGTLAGSISAIRAVGTTGATGPNFYIAANGVAGDSIVASHTDTPTSTAVGKAVIRYWPA